MRGLLRALGSTAFVAVAAGFLLGHYGTNAKTKTGALDRQASAPNFTIGYPSAWRLAPADSLPRLSLTGLIGLSSPQAQGAELFIGTVRTPTPAALPTKLRASLPTAPKPGLVDLGGTAYLRYANLTPRGGGVQESIYLLPTSAGTITAVCTSAQESTAFAAECERVLGTLRVSTGTVLSVAPAAGYALALNPILNDVDTAARSAAPGLAAASARARADAAARLADAEARAAAAAGQLHGDSVSVANSALVRALSSSAGAYRALSRAAAAQDVVAYGRARDAIAGAQRRLSSAYAQLASLGYSVR